MTTVSAGQPAAFEDERREADRAEAAHRDLGEPAPRLEPAGDVAAAVDHPRPAVQRAHRDAQRVGVGGEAIRELVRALVEGQGHRGGSRIRISARLSSTPSPDQRV